MRVNLVNSTRCHLQTDRLPRVAPVVLIAVVTLFRTHIWKNLFTRHWKTWIENLIWANFYLLCLLSFLLKTLFWISADTNTRDKFKKTYILLTFIINLQLSNYTFQTLPYVSLMRSCERTTKACLPSSQINLFPEFNQDSCDCLFSPVLLWAALSDALWRTSVFQTSCLCPCGMWGWTLFPDLFLLDWFRRCLHKATAKQTEVMKHTRNFRHKHTA